MVLAYLYKDNSFAIIMEETHYPEIQVLKEIHQKHNVNISVSNDEFLAGNEDYPAVVFTLDEKSFKLFADDEYKDLPVDNPLLSLCVVLRELEDYEYASDYFVWCKHHAFDVANSQVREYHMNLGSIYKDVEKILGKINSQISDYDFELNAGAARELREKK